MGSTPSKNNYIKEKTTTIAVRFKNDSEMLAFLRTKKNVAGYIKELVKKDIYDTTGKMVSDSIGVGKLKDEDVRYIRENKNSYTKDALCKKFNISITTLNYILRGVTHKNCENLS